MTYLLYTPGIETIEADEQSSIDGIIKGMSQVTEKVEKREHHAVRASHAKSSGLVIGELKIADNLPSELAQGLFSKPGVHAVAVRFAQGPGETLGDRVSTHRGIAIKVFGVEGEKLPGHTAPTQDFVFATGTTFPSGTAKGFLRDAKQIGAATPLPEGFKSAVSATMRGFNTLLHSVGANSPKADFFGHPFGHPLADAYFSQCPIRYGDYVAKLGAFPASDAQAQLKDWKLKPHQDEDGFRHATQEYFGAHPAVFELRVQLWTNADTQSIEDASKEWPTEESAYRTVATLTLPAQDAYSTARQHYFDDQLTFRPANSLAAHRPLGSVMRARLQVYSALAELRQRDNGVAPVSPTEVSQIPV
jgi:hypothetical protein